MVERNRDIKTQKEIGCSDDCFFGYAGESCYPCKHCLGILKKGKDELIKASKGWGTPFDHATYFIDKGDLFLCDKLGKKVWIQARD